MTRPPDSARRRPRPEPADGVHGETTIHPLALDARRLARALGVSVRHVLALRAQGRLPAPVRLGRRRVWPIDEIRAWLAAGAPPCERWDGMREQQGEDS